MGLNQALGAGFALLHAAVADRAHPGRTPVLATAAPDGAPEARIVVLRAVDPVARWVELHTDARSSKAMELAQDPRCTLVFHDPAAGAQLRLGGRAVLHAGDDVARAAWAKVPVAARAMYAGVPVPGTPVPAPPPMPDGATADEQKFLVVRVVFDRMDWLHLDPAGHRRARFRWDGNGPPGMEWVAP